MCIRPFSGFLLGVAWRWDSCEEQLGRMIFKYYLCSRNLVKSGSVTCGEPRGKRERVLFLTPVARLSSVGRIPREVRRSLMNWAIVADACGSGCGREVW